MIEVLLVVIALGVWYPVLEEIHWYFYGKKKNIAKANAWIESVKLAEKKVSKTVKPVKKAVKK